MTNKEKQDLRFVLQTLIEENEDNLEENKYVVITNDIKILQFPKDCYSIKYYSKWFYFEFKMQDFNEVNDEVLQEVNVMNTIKNELGKFELFLWENNYVKISDVAEISRAKSTETNLIVSDEDIDLIDLEHAARENDVETKIKRHNNIDYWLFKFSKKWEVEQY